MPRATKVMAGAGIKYTLSYYLYWLYTRCGNIIYFFIMHGNQSVEVVARWAYSHSRDEILKFPWKYNQSLSCVGVVRNVRLPSKPSFRIECM